MQVPAHEKIINNFFFFKLKALNKKMKNSFEYRVQIHPHTISYVNRSKNEGLRGQFLNINRK